ncbi:multicopper oxidase domain-containing protein [Planotetraspora mira]|uniref:Multicopper oxidase n=1 Tax=Planotetraspora mira TaxID=58121 RepID=A0A8J3XBC9_9ACTN|nr:multicopper oxidase domain-containing protein [Planotetraspora mira]GII34461.1 multicopper oxidase [Planotetraspora mira]
MVTRRQFLKTGAGAAAMLAFRTAGSAAATERALDPAAIPKYVAPLAIPPVMPNLPSPEGPVDHYMIGVRQFQQQILPPGLPTTTVWGYGSVLHPRTFNTPACTVEATVDRPVRITWINELVDGDGRYRPHLLPVDPTLHWANPPGGPSKRDTRPRFASTPGRYRGPVPIVTHLHGGHSWDDSDGHPEAWFLPAARNISAGYAREGSLYSEFAHTFGIREGVRWAAGSAVYQYANDQRAATQWFHDHTLGITRLNVYAGLAGFYLLRGGPSDLPSGVLPGPAPRAGDAPTTRYHEIPILIQDKSFSAGGSLLYPDSRRLSDGFSGPYVPRSDVSPIWVPEFFGTTMTVNGRTWPDLHVEPRRYRFRFLNGCNSRFLDLKIASGPPAKSARTAALPFWQIGSDGGFLPSPVQLGGLLLAPAERADVIVDFTGIPAGTQLFLINEGPDGPYRGARSAPPANPATTGQVMRFTVGPLVDQDTSVPPSELRLPTLNRLGAARLTRRLALLEHSSAVVAGVGPIAALLGSSESRGSAKMWADPITENPATGSTEMWEFHNFTPDAHPMHVHEVQFEVVDRRPSNGLTQLPEPGERGFKDTVIAPPNAITRIKATFDRPGLFVWHCHVLEHEDNEMMRPYRIGA